MADNILTAAEAAQTLRTVVDDPIMLGLLPSLDKYIQNATDHDWAADATISETAKTAARMLLVLWYENPGMVSVDMAPHFGLLSVLSQLEMEAITIAEVASEVAGTDVTWPTSGDPIGDTDIRNGMGDYTEDE